MVVRPETSRNLSLSVLQGIRRARFDRLVVMDADPSHRQLPDLRPVGLSAAGGTQTPRGRVRSLLPPSREERRCAPCEGANANLRFVSVRYALRSGGQRRSRASSPAERKKRTYSEDEAGSLRRR